MEMNKSFFVLWNGSDEGLNPSVREEMIEETAAGLTYPDFWSFGQGYGDPLVGDRVFMLRTGTNRGVVAAGELISDGIFPGEHWGDSGREAKYVDISWDVMLADEDRLPVEEVQSALTDFKFPVLNSGRLIKEPSASVLAELWARHIEDLGRATDNPWLGGRRSAPGQPSSRRIPLEENRIKEYYVENFSSYRARRAESEMMHRFAATLVKRNSDVSSYQMKVDDGARSLLADVFDHTDNVLYEAKASSSREAVRMALGQLLDYRRHIDSKPAVSMLLPDKPVDDLLALLSEHGVGCVYEDSGRFVQELAPVHQQ
ncbi:hypothetical protein J2W54_004833 [Rhodococcus fascians]|uniref:hypothetical protein n=1 Tax=Nocardiaceae TaxID=85025 RepID=UPI0024BA5156|nr:MULTISPECIES: hypothetical protein [Rhodococcus]MDJ0427276.1 hypothetical protein [Rhodococcus fascians]MDR6912900.1 hypothetical protein [Rhodococcus sp. 3258]MDR6934418.1 hypothetical protein [Rhodococcus fascians]